MNGRSERIETLRRIWHIRTRIRALLSTQDPWAEIRALALEAEDLEVQAQQQETTS